MRTRRRIDGTALWLLAAAAAGCPLPAAAHELLLGGDLAFRHATQVDLAERAGSNAYGERNDLSPGMLGVSVTAGVRFDEAWELAARAGLGVGGLALGPVEERYHGDTANVGSSMTLYAGGAARLTPELTDNLLLLAGLGGEWQRMNAASPITTTRLDSLAFGPEVGLAVPFYGVRWDLLLGARAHLPLYVRVGSPKLETTDPAGGPFWSVGVRLGMSWVMRLG